MSCGGSERSGEMLRSLLILCSPTSVSDDTGDTEDVKVEASFSVGHPCFVSATGEPSSFRRFGAGDSDGNADGADGIFLGFLERLLGGWAAFAGVDIGFPVVARVTRPCVRMEAMI
jgi:hypothetical protein